MDDKAPAEENGEKPNAGLPPPDVAKSSDSQAASPATAEQLTEVEEKMSGFEKSTLRWAQTAVIMSGLAAIFVCAQWWEMHEGGIDTHNLADAATKTAQSAEKSAQAAESFSKSAAAINSGISDAVKKLQIQAKGIESLATQATDISKASREQSTIGAGDPIVTYDWAQLGHDRNAVFVDVAAKNIGPEAAITTALNLEIRKPGSKEQKSMKTFQLTSKVGGPGDSSLRKYLPLKGNPGLNYPNARVYFWGAIRYATQAGKPFDLIPFCKSILAADVLQKRFCPTVIFPQTITAKTICIQVHLPTVATRGQIRTLPTFEPERLRAGCRASPLRRRSGSSVISTWPAARLY